jgi:hypothetical protein
MDKLPQSVLAIERVLSVGSASREQKTTGTTAPRHPNGHAQPPESRIAARQKNDSVTTATDQLPGHLVSSAWYLRSGIHDAPSLLRSCSIGEPVVSKPCRGGVQAPETLPLRRASISKRTGSRHRRDEACLADGPSRRGTDGWRNRTPILKNSKLPFTPRRHLEDVAKATKTTPNQFIRRR